MILAGGAWYFLAFLVIYLMAVVHGLYTGSGSGITQRHSPLPPGAGRPDERAVYLWERGTR